MEATKFKLSAVEASLLKAPNPRWACKWFEFKEISYVTECQISKKDIPELVCTIQKWTDEDWLIKVANEDEKVQLLPVTAWRALAELKALEAIEPVLELLVQLEDAEDDWSLEDFPYVLSAMGEPAIAYLRSFLGDDAIGIDARIAALNSLINLGMPDRCQVTAESRAAISAFFLNASREIADNPRRIPDDTDAYDLDFVRFNTQILMGIVELRITEAAASIEQAFSLNQFDVGMIGDWDDVRKELGIESLGLHMPEKPLNSLDRFRKRIGFGIFSNQPLLEDGEPDYEAADDYIANAMNAFAISSEGQKVVERFGSPGWAASFLDYGLNYLGETVDTMSAADADEIVFEIIPSKVSVEASEAEKIIFELNQFWCFLDRVYQLPSAAKIASLFDERSVSRLQAELSEDCNFGMAKSMFMMGETFGFDMTSQAGLENFMAFYNSQFALESDIGDGQFVPADVEPTLSPSPTADMTATQRKAFNKARHKKLAKKKKQKKSKRK